MGCDIHVVAERRLADGRWEAWGTFKDDDGYFCQAGPRQYGNEIYEGRNYRLFTVLAGVRRDSDSIPQIAEPRGVPEDCSPEVRRYMENVDHTPSYVTLRELLDFDWTQEIEVTGAVGWPEFVDFMVMREVNPHHQPNSWCKWTSAPTIPEAEGVRRFHELDHEQRRQIRAGLSRYNDMASTYVQTSWSVPLFVSCQEFLTTTMPRLWQFAKGLDPANVRLVFYFDS